MRSWRQSAGDICARKDGRRSRRPCRRRILQQILEYRDSFPVAISRFECECSHNYHEFDANSKPQLVTTFHVSVQDSQSKTVPRKEKDLYIDVCLIVRMHAGGHSLLLSVHKCMNAIVIVETRPLTLPKKRIGASSQMFF